MLLQILAACPAPSLAAMDDAAPHPGQDRLRTREGRVRAAHHEGQAGPLRPDGAAGDRRVERGEAALGRERMGFPRALDVDGRAIDDEAVRPGRRQDVVPHGQYVAAARQHGDDDVDIGHRLAAARRDGDALGRGRVAQIRHEVVAADLVPRPNEVGGHRGAHIAEPDEGDPFHPLTSSLWARHNDGRSGCPSRRRRMTSRARSFDSLRHAS